MAFTKIDNTDLVDKGVIGLPDTPGLSTAAMQAKLEETARSVIIPKHNSLIDELEDTPAAASLGAAAPTGRTVTANTVQGGLNKLSDDLKVVEDGMAEAIADAHTHTNKALLDTYTQTESDLASAVADDHTHSNKTLLDSYDQTNADIKQAVTDDHTHSNKALLDTYTQTETDIADAVSKKHDHSNKALLDTYTQTETDLADAVSKKHEHSNKTVLDKFGESSGNPTYDGNPIGGGGSGDTFKTIQAGGTSFVASGEDTFKINAGSNVTITALSSPDKGFSISATGGGQSTGDMLMSQYDQSGDVKAASSTGNGIKDFVATEIGKLDVSDSAVSGQYVSAVSEADGKISVTRANLPTVPTNVSDLTNDSGYQTASDVATAISGKEDKSALKDLAYIAKDGVGSTKVLQGDGTWINPPAGYDMIDNSDLLNKMEIALTEGTTNDDVVSAYGVGTWSNAYRRTYMVRPTSAHPIGTTGIGTWDDESTHAGWIQIGDLKGISALEHDVKIVFNPATFTGDVPVLRGYKIEDFASDSTKNYGLITILFANEISSADTEVGEVGVEITIGREPVSYITPS